MPRKDQSQQRRYEGTGWEVPGQQRCILPRCCYGEEQRIDIPGDQRAQSPIMFRVGKMGEYDLNQVSTCAGGVIIDRA
jgi:hypothetical protein